MPIQGIEWIIVGVVIIIILLRPKVIVDFARGIGKMVREFRSGAKGDERMRLEKIAEELGINPDGKSDEELLEEIKRKLSVT
ncbi:MAG: twin-arginine translocase TatA/TatE family subunit [Aigarchaeota archaeon]|nr:twin-arginine translocase TatA/TatE family subunit [Aigarchaeota archaeon]MCX8192518.1 twin-arginine translocase TatA/TatE family subunit [Nitrososphaeria archaeon]MDW7985746.1 twin-arginine translocase TatA/TatE family subunit [Nitrososphaerota archaeon]